MNMSLNTDFQNTADELVTPPYADALVDVLLFLKTQTRMVVLGDTGHEKLDVKLFYSSRPHMERLGKGGFGHLFVEQRAIHQDTYTSLQNGISLNDQEKFFESGWVSKRVRHQIEKRLKETLYNLTAPIFCPIDDCDVSSLYALEPFCGEANAIILNDSTKTQIIREQMESSTEAGLVIYGNGHFCGHAEGLGVPSLHQCLKANGFNPLRIDLHYSTYRWKLRTCTDQEDTRRYYRAADIDFVIGADGKTPEVIFNNAALVKPYRNFRATTAPSLPAPRKIGAAAAARHAVL